MTSNCDVMKTNEEILRRRKLRLQQVREQSKDIAKKVRQRAKVEKLRHIVNINTSKEKEYLQRQEKLVRRLEDLYVKGIQNVGASHKKASEVVQNNIPESIDLSKVRGKEAVAELRRKKQEKLDEQKKYLDRKLQAREAANEVSREKSSTVAKLLSKSSITSNTNQVQSSPTDIPEPSTKNSDNNNNNDEKDKPETLTNEMGTQWDYDGLPNEWIPAVPVLSLPKDDSVKETNNNIESRSDQSKRLNLFALSDEMPSSLRGGHTNVPEERPTIRPSLTLVSEYLQNRGLRLRECDKAPLSNKKQSEDLQKLKQTIIRTRTSKAEGSTFNNVCHVLDEQIVPVPSWEAESNCQFCAHSVCRHSYYQNNSRQFNTITNSEINQIFSSIRPKQHDLLPRPVVRGTSPFRRSKFSGKLCKTSVERSNRSNTSGKGLTKKNSVTVYNHSTRDTKEIPYQEESIVVRDLNIDEDAYSQAIKESNTDNSRDNKHEKIMMDMRNKIAMTKQNVEKEYKDTLAFLNSLPKEKCSKADRNAYMSEERQQMQKEIRQKKLQKEFNKISKECRKHGSMCSKSHPITPDGKCGKSKSPSNTNNIDLRNIQYSWMPVPDADCNLAVHTIPNTIKEGKAGNTVKFSEVDSYHEYRSRHKHTPPTKDTCEKSNKKVVEAGIIQEDSNDTTECSSIASDTSSIENLRIKTKKSKQGLQDKLSDAEKIIIYKILESKHDKKDKRGKSKCTGDVSKSMTSLNKARTINDSNNNGQVQKHKLCKNVENSVSFEQLNEGIYKTVNTKRDNIASTYFDSPEGDNIVLSEDEIRLGRPCRCNRKLSKGQKCDKGTDLVKDGGDIESTARSMNCMSCKCGCADDKSLGSNENPPMVPQPSAATSTASFKTATNDKANNALPDGGYIKLIDDGGQEAGKFYIGASGFLKDDAYEVVIQLRKKDSAKGSTQEESDKTEKISGSETVVQRNEDICRSLQTSEAIHKSKLQHKTRSLLEEFGESLKPRETEESRSGEGKDIQDNGQSKESGSQEKQHTSDSKITVKSPRSLNSESIDSEETLECTGESQSTSSEITPNHPSDGNLREYLASRDQSLAESTCIPPQVPSKSNVTSKPSLSSNKKKRKGPQVNISYALPSPRQKSDPMSKLTTSAYTQTTLSSPIQRPMLIHMSSSTSTAYMSPPEMILPRYMKQDYPITYDEMYEPIPKLHIEDTSIEITENEYCEKYIGCTCKRCIRAKTVTLSEINAIFLNKADMECKNNITTPPNTASSYISTHKHNKDCNKHKNLKSAARNPETSLKHKDKKCKNKCEGKKSIKKSYLHRNKETHNSLLNLESKVIRCHKNKKKYSCDKRTSKYNLNPVIKMYVNKLLALNKEGLKAIEVIKQDCSAVSTPGSSIINVAHNINNKEIHVEKRISLEQIKGILKKQILKECENKDQIQCEIETLAPNIPKTMIRKTRKKPLHKVKSLNISKQFLKLNKTEKTFDNANNLMPETSTSSMKETEENDNIPPANIINKSHSRTSATPKNLISESKNIGTNSNDLRELLTRDIEKNRKSSVLNSCHKEQSKLQPTHITSTNSSESDIKDTHKNRRTQLPEPITISTQTKVNDSENNFMHSAEGKLQNMDKIAELTEKCTKRLSNLAKVLEEVRKNKSLAYSQISTSDSASDTDQKPDKNIEVATALDPVIDNLEVLLNSPHPQTKVDNEVSSNNSRYLPFLTDIPKPSPSISLGQGNVFKMPETSYPAANMNCEQFNTRSRAKPPPALSRVNLKNTQEYVVPHELSTVMEVDSPMSLKLKNQSPRDEDKCENTTKSNHITDDKNNRNIVDKNEHRDCSISKGADKNGIHDLLQSTLALKRYNKSTDGTDVSKIEMMDLKQFNNIMLEPFISLHEFAKQCNVGHIDDGSNLESNLKDDVVNDEFSSLHSDGSLPDVISELLKRNIISEPFKYDTPTYVNSTTVSSESTLSLLALSKVRKDKKSIMFHNKENIGETSDTHSVSSNPDLENAFKKLGMGWASSTLKKTKERLALSSSSNTSSSSMSQYKLRNFNQDIPVSDSVSSVTNISAKQGRNVDVSKNAQQQTSLTNSMTVREFLTQELANKITFTNKSRNMTEEEFVSLYETKMPEEMKHSSQMICEDRSMDSAPSGNNNRARTSTPVQLFKSMTYHTSSSSNMSNGLFSNADDLSSVKMTSNSIKNHSTSDKDDLTIPNYSLKMKKSLSDRSKSD